MHYDNVPGYMAALTPEGGIGALALRFTILTVARIDSVIGAEWPENLISTSGSGKFRRCA
jgi:hypothetical protein